MPRLFSKFPISGIKQPHDELRLIPPLSHLCRITWGMTGGMMVAIFAYPFGDYAEWIQTFSGNVDEVWVFGWSVRLFIYATLGALWSYFHDREASALGALQLGMVGPVIFFALMSAANSGPSSIRVSDVSWEHFDFVSQSYAAETMTETQKNAQEPIMEEISSALKKARIQRSDLNDMLIIAFTIDRVLRQRALYGNNNNGAIIKGFEYFSEYSRTNTNGTNY